MKTLLAAATVLAALSGTAAAQEAPQLAGRLSANVAREYDRGEAATLPRVDRTRTASTGERPFRIGSGRAAGSAVYRDLHRDDRYSGR